MPNRIGPILPKNGKVGMEENPPASISKGTGGFSNRSEKLLLRFV
jgi:hypothetical protein